MSSKVLDQLLGHHRTARADGRHRREVGAVEVRVLEQRDQHRGHAEHAVDPHAPRTAGARGPGSNWSTSTWVQRMPTHPSIDITEPAGVEQRHLRDVGVAGLHAHPVEVVVPVVDQTAVMQHRALRERLSCPTCTGSSPGRSGAMCGKLVRVVRADGAECLPVGEPDNGLEPGATRLCSFGHGQHRIAAVFVDGEQRPCTPIGAAHSRARTAGRPG